MTAEGTIFLGHQFQTFIAFPITWIGHETQGAVQSHRADIAAVQSNDAATRVTCATVDTLGLVIERFAFFAGVRDAVEIVFIEIGARDKIRHRAHISAEERFEVDSEIARDREIAQRFDFDVVADSFDERAAGQAFFSVHHHCAGAAHAYPAGETEGQIGHRAALQGEKSIENTGPFANLHLVPFESGGLPCFG